MADNPRIPAMAKKWRALEPTETGRTVEQFIAELLPAADAVDPLRVLLADEDRAVEVIRDAIAKSDGGTLSSRYLKETSVAVLAALREVADGG